MNDVAFAKLAEERELTPSAHVTVRTCSDTAGEPNPNNTAAMVREYVMPRKT